MLAPPQISSWVRFHWLLLGLTLSRPVHPVLVPALHPCLVFSVPNPRLRQKASLYFPLKPQFPLEMLRSKIQLVENKATFCFLAALLKMVLQDGILGTPSMHKPFFPPPLTDATRFPRARGNGDCSSKKGKSTEISQCDSEISRRGLSSSLDPPTSALISSPPFSLPLQQE